MPDFPVHPRHNLEHHCRDLSGWPSSWMGLEKDLPLGEQFIAVLRPFFEYPAASDFPPEDHSETGG